VKTSVVAASTTKSAGKLVAARSPAAAGAI
jgi:hypothetical protein